MRDAYTQELLKLQDNKYVNQGFWDLFMERLDSNPLLTRDEDPVDHFGSYCLPVCKRSQQVYAGHHKKANFWLPPGGHIDKGETPQQTAIREFSEELNYKITTEKIDLINIEMPTINNAGRACRIHFDFWYIIYLDTEISFEYSQAEYFTAQWLSIDELLKHNTLLHYIPIYNSLRHILN